MEPVAAGVPDRLPGRVARELDRRAARAEILIGWFQLGFMLFLATLYAIAPRAEGSQGFNFVPYALAAYCVFTLLRLALSYRMELPGWYLILSIVIDILLLFGIIFSFHIQYHQHPTFYLKAPTMMYIFLFITLRALRFEPRYVVITGALSMAGWAGLVAYAVFSDPSHMYVTRNYVDYLTGNAILFGAEIDKLMIIGAVTAILAIALARGRQLLVASVREHAAALELKRFFAPEVAETIAGADEELHVGEGSVRNVAVLLFDVRGFTATSAGLPPEATMRILSLYQGIAVPAIQAHGGRVDKFLGDGILATFGAIDESETYAADAMAAAFEVLAALEDSQAAFREHGWPHAFSVGCAVSSGPVVVGLVGVESRLEHTVIGSAVNLSTKLEDANKDLGTRFITSRDCFDTACAQGFVPPPGLVTTAGYALRDVEHRLDVVTVAK